MEERVAPAVAVTGAEIVMGQVIWVQVLEVLDAMLRSLCKRLV